MKGWKTITFNILSLFVLVLGSDNFLALIPEDAWAYIPGAIALINVVLRFLTNGPVFNSAKLKGGANLLYLGVLLLFGVFLVGAQPTITQTTIWNAGGANYYKYTFSSSDGAADSAIIYKDNSSVPFDISYMLTGNNTDSTIYFYFASDEATADSVRYNLEHQVSYNGTDWTTWETDALNNATSFIASFKPHRYGKPYLYRALLRENDTDKDATQNLTVEAVFPTPR